mgnify:CR=1 FL=1
MNHRATSTLLVLALLSPACRPDLTQDFTETFLITDPVDRFEIVVDRGSLLATSYDLPVVKVKRHTFGWASSIGTADYTLEDGVYSFEAHCDSRVDECTWDHLLEVPSGIDFDLTMTEALIDVGDLDGDFTAEFEIGEVRGHQLRTANFSLTGDAATVDVDFAAPPTSLKIQLDDGEVFITVPTGAYRCDFAGDPEVSGITCDDAAAATLDLDVGAGSLTIAGE